MYHLSPGNSEVPPSSLRVFIHFGKSSAIILFSFYINELVKSEYLVPTRCLFLFLDEHFKRGGLLRRSPKKKINFVKSIFNGKVLGVHGPIS